MPHPPRVRNLFPGRLLCTEAPSPGMFLRGLCEISFALLTPAPGVSEKAEQPLELSAEPQRRRTGYAHPIPHYCPIYETNERGIKVWLKKGRDAGDPVPLDDAEAMPGWWRRNSPQTVPAKLILAAQRAAAVRGAAADPAAIAPVAPPAPDSPAPPVAPTVSPARAPALPAPTQTPRSSVVLDDSTEGITLADAMPRLERMLAHAILDYEAKAKDPLADESSMVLADARLNKAIERHRKLESTLNEMAQKRGDLVAVAELRPQLAAIFARLAGTLVEDTMQTFAVSRPAAVAFADAWFGRVRELPFGDAAQIEQARAA